MSKELEALNTIRKNLSNKTLRFNLVELLDIIESALHRLEAIENANPSEALKDLAFIKEKFAYLEYNSENYNVPKKELSTIEQALIKAQEQEKEKGILEYTLKKILKSAKVHSAGTDEMFTVHITVIDNSEVANYLKELLENEENRNLF